MKKKHILLAAALCAAPLASAQDLVVGSSSMGGDGTPYTPPSGPRIRPRGSLPHPQIVWFDPATITLDTSDGLPQSPTHWETVGGLMERAARGKTTGIGTARTQADMGPLRYEHLLRCATNPVGNRYFLYKGMPDSGPDYGTMVSVAPIRIVAHGAEVIPAHVNVTVEMWRWRNGAWESLGIIRNVTLTNLGDARWVTTPGDNNIAGDSDDVKPVIQDPDAPAQILTYVGPAVNIVASTPDAIPVVLNTLRNGAYTFRVKVTVPYSFNGQPQTPLTEYRDVQGTVDFGKTKLVPTPATNEEWDLSDSTNGLVYAFQKSGDLQNWSTVSTFTGTGNTIHLGAIMAGDMDTSSRKFYRVTWRGETLPPVTAP